MGSVGRAVIVVQEQVDGRPDVVMVRPDGSLIATLAGMSFQLSKADMRAFADEMATE